MLLGVTNVFAISTVCAKDNVYCTAHVILFVGVEIKLIICWNEKCLKLLLSFEMHAVKQKHCERTGAMCKLSFDCSLGYLDHFWPICVFKLASSFCFYCRN